MRLRAAHPNGCLPAKEWVGAVASHTNGALACSRQHFVKVQHTCDQGLLAQARKACTHTQTHTHTATDSHLQHRQLVSINCNPLCTTCSAQDTREQKAASLPLTRASESWEAPCHTLLGAHRQCPCDCRTHDAHSPAAASTMASSWPSCSILTRASMLPRTGTTFRLGWACNSCALRRRLLVPTRAPLGRSAAGQQRDTNNTHGREEMVGGLSGRKHRQTVHCS